VTLRYRHLRKDLGVALSDRNRLLIRRIHEEGESQGNLTVIDEAYAPEFVDARHPDRGAGPDGVKRHIKRLRAAFPDLRVSVEDLIAEGDKVVVRVTSRGTHRAAFAGVAPTGAAVAWSGIVIRRIGNGRVVEQWSQYDTADLVRQLSEAAQSSGGAEAPPVE
jgi:predicted ester cyclase